MKRSYFKDSLRKSQDYVEGITYSKHSRKWLVRLQNITRSKNARLIITAAQFDKKEDAEKYLNLHVSAR